ncbi:hypothetical protein M404DRAFT_1002071 [Pisolithus tinctorius Marx 270]|uniref:Uncharacterized protein n=1 Tax=Pisolithus tinctorius Marx 270 TaxID=870435 RepID=A0A0C3NPS0_PISTI|nr:hypothetical protein M404DRAFT_1002071 [Pisolithus tinctorius Marx 270]
MAAFSRRLPRTSFASSGLNAFIFERKILQDVQCPRRNSLQQGHGELSLPLHIKNVAGGEEGQIIM